MTTQTMTPQHSPGGPRAGTFLAPGARRVDQIAASRLMPASGFFPVMMARAS